MNRVRLTPSGTTSSLASSLTTSASGWNQRGPSRFWYWASSLRSAHSKASPESSRISPLGKSNRAAIVVTVFISSLYLFSPATLPVVAREAGVDARQNQRHVGKLVAERQLDHRGHVADGWRAHVDPRRLVAAVALDEVEDVAARRFQPADRLAGLDPARHARRQLALRHVGDQLAEQPVALEQLAQADDEAGFQVAAVVEDHLHREVAVGEVGRVHAQVTGHAGRAGGRSDRAKRLGLLPRHHAHAARPLQEARVGRDDVQIMFRALLQQIHAGENLLDYLRRHVNLHAAEDV